MASFICDAFKNSDGADGSPVLEGGPCGGNAGMNVVGDVIAEPGLELYCERFPEEELEPEPGDLRKPVAVRITVRLEGFGARVLAEGFALVKIRVKY